MSHKSFTTNYDARRAWNRENPVEFTIGEHAFQIEAIPVGALIDLAEHVDDEGPAALLAFRDFLHAITPDEDVPRLKQAMAVLDLEGFFEVVKGVQEAERERNARRPADLAAGRLDPTAMAATGSPSSAGRTSSGPNVVVPPTIVEPDDEVPAGVL